MTPYVDIAGARRLGTVVQVRGKILHNTVEYNTAMGALTFELQDVRGQTIEVVYHQAKPDAFDTAPETAARGIVKHDAQGHEYFDSDDLVIKCPSKYDDTTKSPYTQKVASKGTV